MTRRATWIHPWKLGRLFISLACHFSSYGCYNMTQIYSHITQIVSWFLLQCETVVKLLQFIETPVKNRSLEVFKKLRGRTTNQWSNVPSIFGPGVMDGVADDHPSPKSCSGFTFFGPKERHAKDIKKDLKVYSIQIAVVFHKHNETKSLRRTHAKMTLRPMAMAPARRHSVSAGYTCHAPLHRPGSWKCLMTQLTKP